MSKTNQAVSVYKKRRPYPLAILHELEVMHPRYLKHLQEVIGKEAKYLYPISYQLPIREDTHKVIGWMTLAKYPFKLSEPFLGNLLTCPIDLLF